MGSDALTCWAAAIMGPNADAASRMTLHHRSRVPGISAMLSLCTNRKSNHCASAFGDCRHAGISWFCGTIREAGHGDEHRGAKVTMPMSWRHANMWTPFSRPVLIHDRDGKYGQPLAALGISWKVEASRE